MGAPAALRRALAAALGAALLDGCAGPRLPPPPPVAPPPPLTDASLDQPGLVAFERVQRARADAAARAGRWFEAQAAWDAVIALAPDDERARRGMEQARAAARAEVATWVPRAREARRRGDLTTAQSLWLKVLGLDPRHKEAAESLRAIEVERVRRRLVASPPQGSFARPMAPPARQAPPAPPAGRNEVEHASLLAQQGEIDEAIALLRPLALSRPVDPAARSLLASLYVRKADRLAGTDPLAAIEALQRSLRLSPGDAGVTGRLRAMRAAAAKRRQGTAPPPQAGETPPAASNR